MNQRPTYEDILGVIAQVSVGDATVRVGVPEAPDPDDALTSLALALNMLLDDLDLQHRERLRNYAEIQAQQEAIRRLWTPVLSVADGVLLLPLVGWIDAERAKQMMETVLLQVHAVRARAVIIDLTAVPELDAYAAGTLGQLTSAVRLLGADVVIAGISAVVAQAMTLAGIDFRNTRTEPNLAKAIGTSTDIARRGRG